VIPDGRFLIGRKTSNSFPSSHAMNMFAQATLFSLLYRRRAAWFFLFAAIIGFSRIYVGVHYPFDVLGGALFGMCIGGLVYWVYDGAQAWWRRRKTDVHDGVVGA
jgi:undecaprenyl-diphosphatase